MTAHPNGAASARFVTRDQLAGDPAWQRCLAGLRKDHRYYEILEDTLEHEHNYRYCVVQDPAGEVLAVQPFFLLDQDVLDGAAPALRRAAAIVRRVLPRFLLTRTLMVGCAAGEGHLGQASRDGTGEIAALLRKALANFAKQNKARLIVFKEFPADYRKDLAPLTLDGYTRVPSLPMVRLNIDSPDFDALMARSMSKSARKDLRRKLRGAAQGPPLEMTVVNDCTPLVDELYPLYLQVYDRSKLHFEKLTKPYLCELGQRMPDRTRFFVWRQLGKAVAFSLCMVHGDALYDEYLGLDYSVALDLHLYFITLAGVLAWAIANRYKWYYSSSLGYDPKLHLGCELVPLDLYITHTSPVVNFFLRRVVPWLGPTRDDPTLKKFRNYAALWGAK